VSVIRQKLADAKFVGKMDVVEQEEDEEDTKDTKKKKNNKKKGMPGAPKKEDLMRIQLSRDKVLDQTNKMLQMMGQASQEIKLFEEEFLRVE
jgi:hypothetical protein